MLFTAGQYRRFHNSTEMSDEEASNRPGTGHTDAFDFLHALFLTSRTNHRRLRGNMPGLNLLERMRSPFDD